MNGVAAWRAAEAAVLAARVVVCATLVAGAVVSARREAAAWSALRERRAKLDMHAVASASGQGMCAKVFEQ